MANVFPEIEPVLCRRGYQGFERVIRAADGSPQFNVPHPYLQTLFHNEWDVTLTLADRRTVITHWKTNRAALFTFFFFNGDEPLDETVIGTGNGSQTIFTIPAKSTSGLTIKKKVSGVWVTQLAGTHYTYNPGTGAEGEDQITFAAAPLTGQDVSAAAAKARQRYYLYYTPGQKVQEEHIEADTWRLALDMEERVPA